MNKPIIITKTGILPGPTLAVFAGVHGNEQAGILAFNSLLPTLNLDRGIVHFVIANPLAVKKQIRYIDVNLNRRFLRNNNGNQREDKLARVLMGLLDGCNALLDLHSCDEPDIDPFIICEEASLPLAKTMGVETVSIGWKEFEKGSTESYMDSQGKIGICVECGSSSEPDRYAEFAKNTILEFLTFFGCLQETMFGIENSQQRIIRITNAITMDKGGMAFMRNYKSFDNVFKGELIAKSRFNTYRAPENAYIIFPRPNNPIGSEAYLLGVEQQM